jgi:hypothetical protein
MNPAIAVVRAIGVEFGRRKLRPLLIIGLVVAVVLLAFGGWLTTVNVWWWLLETAFIIYALLLLVVVIAVQFALRLAEPHQNGDQRQAVRHFVDKLERVAENLQTPQPVIIFRVIRDTLRPRKDNFIETVSRDSKSLAPDFAKLLKHFGTDRDKARP